MTPLLELKNVSKRFGGLEAIGNVSFEVRPGTVLGLIGPNGAGKTTLVNLISGAERPSAGEIIFKGKPIVGVPAFRLSRIGIARTFQIVQPFPEMTALENVVAAATFAGRITHLSQASEFAQEQLERVGLGPIANVQASLLTLGQRKRLEFAKSLAMNPDLLLLDEVNAGLHGAELGQAISLIRSLSQSGLTILIIEHLMKVVTTLCDEIVVLHHGKKICQGAPDAVVQDPLVIEAYLGEKYSQRLNQQSSSHPYA